MDVLILIPDDRDDFMSCLHTQSGEMTSHLPAPAKDDECERLLSGHYGDVGWGG